MALNMDHTQIPPLIPQLKEVIGGPLHYNRVDCLGETRTIQLPLPPRSSKQKRLDFIKKRVHKKKSRRRLHNNKDKSSNTLPIKVVNHIIDSILPNQHEYPSNFLNDLLNLAGQVPWTKNSEKYFNSFIKRDSGITAAMLLDKFQHRVVSYLGMINKFQNDKSKESKNNTPIKTIPNKIKEENPTKRNVEQCTNNNNDDDDVIFVPAPAIKVIEVNESDPEDKDVENNTEIINNQELPDEASNDFLASNDTDNISDNFNFSLLGQEFVDCSFTRPPDPTDVYEIESNTTTSEVTNAIDSSMVFKEINFSDENLFQGDDLSGFKALISSQNYNKLDPIAGVTAAKKPKRKRHSKSKTASESSSESDYEALNTTTQLPELSQIDAPSNITNSVEKRKSKKTQKKLNLELGQVENKRRKKSKKDEEFKSDRIVDEKDALETSEENLMKSSQELDESATEVTDLHYNCWQESITDIQDQLYKNEHIYSPNFIHQLIFFAEYIPWSKKCENLFRKLRKGYISEKVFLKTFRRKLRKNSIAIVTEQDNAKNTTEKPKVQSNSQLEYGNNKMHEDPTVPTVNNLMNQNISEVNNVLEVASDKQHVSDTTLGYEISKKLNPKSSQTDKMKHSNDKNYTKVPLPMKIENLDEEETGDKANLLKRKSQDVDGNGNEAKRLRKESDKQENCEQTSKLDKKKEMINDEEKDKEVDTILSQEVNNTRSGRMIIEKTDKNVVGQKRPNSERIESIKEIEENNGDKSSSEIELEKNESKTNYQEACDTIEITNINQASIEDNRLETIKGSVFDDQLNTSALSKIPPEACLNTNNSVIQQTRPNKRKHEDSLNNPSETSENDEINNQNVLKKFVITDTWQDELLNVESIEVSCNEKRAINSHRGKSDEDNERRNQIEDQDEESETIMLNSAYDSMNKDFILIEEGDDCDVSGVAAKQDCSPDEESDNDDVLLIEDKINPIVLSDTSDSDMDLYSSDDETNIKLVNTTLPLPTDDERFHRMSNDPNKWHIIDADKDSVRKRSKNEKCQLCKTFDHSTSKCPKLKDPKCALCGTYGHLKRHCTNRICLRCGNPLRPSASECLSCVSLKGSVCKICKEKGHLSNYCSDLWRRYHLTTKQGPLVIPSTKHYELKSKEYLWCSHCGQRGHLCNECEKRRQNTIPATLVSQSASRNPYYLKFNTSAWKLQPGNKEDTINRHQLSNVSLKPKRKHKHAKTMEEKATSAYKEHCSATKSAPNYFSFLDFDNVKLKNNLLTNKLTGMSLYLPEDRNPRVSFTTSDSSDRKQSRGTNNLGNQDIVPNPLNCNTNTRSTRSTSDNTTPIEPQPATFEMDDPNIFYRRSREYLQSFVKSSLDELMAMDRNPLTYIIKCRKLFDQLIFPPDSEIFRQNVKSVFKELNMFIFGIWNWNENEGNMHLLEDFVKGIIPYDTRGSWRSILQVAFESVFNCNRQNINYLEVLTNIHQSGFSYV